MDDPVLDAARSIRAYLPDLLDPDEAVRVDGELAHHLQAEDAGAILAELERHEATGEWAAEFFEHGAPREVVAFDERGFTPAPGHGEPVKVPKFACPRGDYVWYRHAVGQRPPRCPTHHCDLVRAA